MSAECLITTTLLAAALCVACAAHVFGAGKKVDMGKLYDSIKGKWPYIIAVATPVVVGAHQGGYLTDNQFGMLATLGGAGGLAALRGSLKATVADAIARKVAVQIRQGKPPESLIEEDEDLVRPEPPRRPRAPVPVTERRVVPAAPPPAGAYEEHDPS